MWNTQSCASADNYRHDLGTFICRKCSDIIFKFQPNHVVFVFLECSSADISVDAQVVGTIALYRAGLLELNHTLIWCYKLPKLFCLNQSYKYRDLKPLG